MFLIEKQTVRILIQYIVDYAFTTFKEAFHFSLPANPVILGQRARATCF